MSMHRYRVMSCEQATPTTLLLTLEKDPDDTRPISFHPGQYAAISTHRGRPSVARCFSIVSSPTDDTRLQFSMRTAGKYTTRLKRLQPGDEVDVRGPFGGFVIDPMRDTQAVLLAGGIGITPFMSMLRYARDTNSTTPMALFYGVASQDDVPFLDELKQLAKTNPHLQITVVVAQGETDKIAPLSVKTGFVSADLIREQATPSPDATYFLCGPPPFMNALLKSLRASGVNNDRLITEAFSQGPHRQTGRVASWPQNMYVMTGLGLALGTLVVAVSDVFKTLPKVQFANGDTLNQPLSTGNIRDQELDALINKTAPDLNGDDSPGARAAKQAAMTATSTTSPVASAPTQTTKTAPTTNSSSSTNTTVTPTTPSTPPTTTTPTPPPQPVCTTSQSGVKTCV